MRTRRSQAPALGTRPAALATRPPALATRPPALARVLVLALAPVLLLIPACTSLPRGERPPTGRIFSLPVHTLEGEFETLENPAGRIGVVVVFATWCDLCDETFAAVRRSSEAAGEVVVPVAVSVDADPRQLARYLGERPPGMPVLWDREGKAATRRLALEQVPTVLVVDGSGRIRRVFSGWDRAVERALQRAVAQLLEE